MDREVLLDLVEEQFNLVIGISKNIKFDGGNENNKIAMAYYSKMLETVKAILVLIKENSFTIQVMSLMRSLLEIEVDLINLSQYEWYYDYLKIIAIKNDLKVLDRAIRYKKKNNENKYIEYAYRNKSIDELNKLREEFNKLLVKFTNSINNKAIVFFNKQGNLIIKDKIYYKFELANRTDVYESLYYCLCNETHNDLTNIYCRYIENNNVRLFKKIENGDIGKITDLISVVLNTTISSIYKILNKEEDRNIVKINSIRNKISSHLC